MDVNKWYNMLSDKLQEWMDTLIIMLPNFGAAILILLGFFIIARISKKIIRKLLGKFSSHISINRLISQIAFITLFAIGFFIALGVLNLDKAVTSLLAGAGIIGLALGFAFQDMAANFMSGIAISIRQPFKINDMIKSNDYFGKVQKINLRTTDILTPQGQIVLIPNKEVFQKPLINYSVTGVRRIDLAVGVSYGDDLEKVMQVTLAAAKGLSNQDENKEVELFYEEFGDSSINFVLRIWTKFSTEAEFKKATSEAIMKIKKAFDSNDITIPFPIRTLDFGIKGGEKLSEMKSIDVNVNSNQNNK